MGPYCTEDIRSVLGVKFLEPFGRGFEHFTAPKLKGLYKGKTGLPLT
jgi:hypothetical protein